MTAALTWLDSLCGMTTSKLAGSLCAWLIGWQAPALAPVPPGDCVLVTRTVDVTELQTFIGDNPDSACVDVAIDRMLQLVVPGSVEPDEPSFKPAKQM